MNIKNDSLAATREALLNKIQAKSTESKSCLVPVFNVRGSKVGSGYVGD